MGLWLIDIHMSLRAFLSETGLLSVAFNPGTGDPHLLPPSLGAVCS